MGSEPTVLDPDTPPPIPPTASTMTDQDSSQNAVTCIICLSDLAQGQVPLTGEHEPVARLLPCSHTLHDRCLAPWIKRANSCPICRTSFNEVHCSATIGGTVLGTYPVEMKMQVFETDLDMNMGTLTVDNQHLACEVCIRTDNLEVLLMCDGCHKHYHNYCIGMDEIPEDRWFCADCEGIPQETRPNAGIVGATQRLIEHRRWQQTWRHLDADLDRQDGSADENDYDSAESRDTLNNQANNLALRQHARLHRRRAVAAAQAPHAPNAFDEPMPWMRPISRPRTHFPHLQKPMTEEEKAAWRWYDVSEQMSSRKRIRDKGAEIRASLSPLSTSPFGSPERSPSRSPRQRKRPKTKRDSEFAGRSNWTNGESSGSSSRPLPVEPSSTSVLTSILERVGKSPDFPLDTTAIAWSDYSRMQASSPGSSNGASPIIRPISPALGPPFTLASPPRSRPHSPFQLSSTIGPNDFVPVFPYSPSSIRGPVLTPTMQPIAVHNRELSPSSSSSSSPPPHVRAHSPVQQRAISPSGSTGHRRQNLGSPVTTPTRHGPIEINNESTIFQQQNEGDVNQRRGSSIAAKDKEDIASMVRNVLKPLYPDKLTKDQFTEINKNISRKLYQLFFDSGSSHSAASEKAKWQQLAELEVSIAVEAL